MDWKDKATIVTPRRDPAANLRDPYEWFAILRNGALFDGAGRGELTLRGLPPVKSLYVTGPGLSIPFKIDVPRGATPSVFHRSYTTPGEPHIETFFIGWESEAETQLFEFGRSDKIRLHRER